MFHRRDHKLLGVHIDDISLDEALRISEAWLREGGLHQVATVGPEFILEATANPTFLRIINSSALSLPEGIGVKVGFMLSGHRHRHRVPGVTYVAGLMSLAAHHGRSVFLYGGAPGVAADAARELLRRYPGLKIAGVESGTRHIWGRVPDHRIAERIHHAKPDILLVALGAPKQELWIDRHRDALHDVKIAIGVGRTFDYLSGRVPEPPAWVRRFGVEWLHTFVNAGRLHQPKMRRQRVKNATFHFLRHVLTQ